MTSKKKRARPFSAAWLCAMALVLSSWSVGGAAGEPIHIDDVRKRLIAWVPVGGLVYRPETRNIGGYLPEYGWVDSWFIPGVLGIMGANDRGLRRVMVHSPFGRVKPMQFDQYIEAQGLPALSKVTGGFVESWRDNVTDPALGLGIEVIAYVGSPRFDPDSQAIIASDGEQAFYDYAWAAVDPLIQAGMSVGLDAAASASEDSATYRFAEMLRASGTKVYIEATPWVHYDWWFDYPAIVLEETWAWRRLDPRFATREDMRGELIRIVRSDRQWLNSHSPGDWPVAACRIIAEGDTLALSFKYLQQPQRNLEDLVDCANAYLADAQNGS